MNIGRDFAMGACWLGLKKQNPTTNMIPLSPLLTEFFVLNEERFPSLFNDSHTTKENRWGFVIDNFPPGVPPTENQCLQFKELAPVSPCNFHQLQVYQKASTQGNHCSESG